MPDSFLITPPDQSVEKNNINLTFIDISEQDLETIINYCRTAKHSYNLYKYDSSVNNIAWLMQAVEESRAILINADKVSEFYLKHILMNMRKTYYYGDNIQTPNSNKISDVLEFFEQINKGKQHVIF